MNDVYKGELVRLSAVDAEEAGKAFSHWNRDSELSRYHMFRAGRLSSSKTMMTNVEKELDEQSINAYWFSIRNLEDGMLLGDIGLYVLNWLARDAIVGLAIGERQFWGKGYGTDAMRIALRYAFTEINLNRVTLVVFEYNPRAIRSYEKAGFRREGQLRKSMNKEGRRWDAVNMGILREEWMDMQPS